MLHAARCKCRSQKSRQKSPSGHHPTTLSGYIFATKAHIDNRKKSLSSNISSTCPHNMVNFGPLLAEIISLVWRTPGNFNGFRVLAVLLHGTLVVGVSQTLRPFMNLLEKWIRKSSIRLDTKIRLHSAFLQRHNASTAYRHRTGAARLFMETFLFP